jgi:hypothetical protein
VPLTLDKIEVNVDFHIFGILNFDVLLGYPLEKPLDTPQESLNEKFRETASAVATSCLENPLAKPHPKQNPLRRCCMDLYLYRSSVFSLNLQNLPLPKNTTQKKSLTFVKVIEHHHPESSLNLFPLARSTLFSTMIEIQP